MIVWVNFAETLLLKLPPPVKVAVIECVPCASECVVNVAVPPLGETVASVVAPSLKVTGAPGVPEN